MTEILRWRAKSHGMAECKSNVTEPWYHTYISWWVSVNTNWAAHDKATGGIGVQRCYNTGCPTDEIFHISKYGNIWQLRCHVCNGNKWWKPLLLIVDGAVADYEFLIIVIRSVWQGSFVAVDKQDWLKAHPHSMQKIWHSHQDSSAFISFHEIKEHTQKGPLANITAPDTVPCLATWLTAYDVVWRVTDSTVSRWWGRFWVMLTSRGSCFSTRHRPGLLRFDNGALFVHMA